MCEYRYTLIAKENYSEFYKKSQKLDFGPMLLPKIYEDKLWGILVYKNNVLVAGWVGTKRINNRIIASLYQEVVYNSHPLILEDSLSNESFSQQIIETAMSYAKKAGISNLVISQWSRHKYVYNLSNYIQKWHATFIIDVSIDSSKLKSALGNKQRGAVNKAFRHNLQFTICDNKNIDKDIIIFDNLRKSTQRRSISKNANSSMLMKSINYYKHILNNYDSRLISVSHDDKIIAMLLFLKSGSIIYPYYSGSDMESNRAYGASAYMFWMLFMYAKEIGCKYFDMGGSPINPNKNHPAFSIYTFKKSFGGEYQEFSCGDIVISKWKYNLVKSLKESRSFMRFFSTKM